MDKIEAQGLADDFRAAAEECLKGARSLAGFPSPSEGNVNIGKAQVYATLALAMETRAAAVVELVSLAVPPGPCEARWDETATDCLLRSGHAGRHEGYNGMTWTARPVAGVSEREA